MSEFWYYIEDNETRGPIALDQLIKLLSQLPTPRGVFVWREGFDDWKAAENVREIVEKLIRPPPLRPRSSIPIPHAEPSAAVAAGDVSARKAKPPPLEEELDTVARYQQRLRKDKSAEYGTVSRYQQQFGNVEPGLPSDQDANTRGRIAFSIVFIIVFLLGTYFASQIYGKSANGITYLIGELFGAWVLLSALTWWARKSAYTAAIVLAVAAFSVGLRNIGALQESSSAHEAKAELQGTADPKQIDEVLRQHSSNPFLQLMAMANKAATETNAASEKLSDEIEPPALSKDIDLAMASRSDLEGSSKNNDLS